MVFVNCKIKQNIKTTINNDDVERVFVTKLLRDRQ